MDISRQLPLLFALPDPRSGERAITWSLLVAGISSLAYAGSGLWSGFPFFGLMVLLTVMHGFVCITSVGANLLYIFRYFLTWLLIWATALVWALFPKDIYVAPFGLEYQTVDYTRILVLAGVLALCGSLIGWTLATSPVHGTAIRYQLAPEYRGRLARYGVMLALAFGTLYIWKSGGVVGDGKAYADGQEGFELEFGVFNVFHYIGIAFLILASVRENGFAPWKIILGAATLVMGILAGSRADYLPQLFILLLLLFNRPITVALSRGQIGRLLFWAFGVLVALVFGYLVASYVAIWRTGLDPVEAWRFMQDNDRGSIVNDAYGHKMLYFETGNMMLGGFYSAIVQVERGITGYLGGESYFNYLLIAPPSFLGLPRPEGLEMKMDLSGTLMSQGGIFEVAEAYWNFGFVGAFGVPLLISYFLGRVLARGLTFCSYFYLVLYLVMGFMGFRAVWYQNFSYFRILTIMLLLYLSAVFFAKWFVAHRARDASEDRSRLHPL